MHNIDRQTFRSHQRRRGLRGFTIAESLIASVVLAAAVVGVAGALSASHQQATAMQQNTEAVSLARQLMEEIISRPFSDPDGGVALGPDGAESDGAAYYDNIDDYHGYTDASTAGTVPSTGKSDVAGGDTFTRTVSVEYRDTPNGSAVSSGPYAIVTVEILTPRGETVRLTQLVSSWTRGE